MKLTLQLKLKKMTKFNNIGCVLIKNNQKFFRFLHRHQVATSGTALDVFTSLLHLLLSVVEDSAVDTSKSQFLQFIVSLYTPPSWDIVVRPTLDKTVHIIVTQSFSEPGRPWPGFQCHATFKDTNCYPVMLFNLIFDLLFKTCNIRTCKC